MQSSFSKWGSCDTCLHIAPYLHMSSKLLLQTCCCACSASPKVRGDSTTKCWSRRLGARNHSVPELPHACKQLHQTTKEESKANSDVLSRLFGPCGVGSLQTSQAHQTLHVTPMQEYIAAFRGRERVTQPMYNCRLGGCCNFRPGISGQDHPCHLQQCCCVAESDQT